MSVLKAGNPICQGKPLTGLCSVCPGVKQDRPCAVGEDSAPGTQGLMGTTGPQVTFGGLLTTEAGVVASSPVGCEQGVAPPPIVGAKVGAAQSAKYAQLTKTANMASTTMYATQQGAQSLVTNSNLPDCTAATSANYPNNKSNLQLLNLGTLQIYQANHWGFP